MNVPEQRIRALIVDDHYVVREGVRRVLEVDDVEIVGEASDGASALRLVERFTPDVVVMDVALPGLNGIEATRRITRERRCAVLVLSASADERTVRRCLRAGARGFILKDCDPQALVAAVRTVARGEAAFGPEVAHHLLGASQAPEPDHLDCLSTREREVLQLVGEGRTTAQIARRLSISPTTVESHRRQIMSKLGLRNRAQLVRFALREGLTS